LKIGVLALQGDFIEHIGMLRRIGVETSEVRLPEHLDGLDGLIIPGGESTTIGKMAVDYHLMEPLRQFGAKYAVWGTCAGAIFLSTDAHRQQPLLGLMDIFEIDLEIAVLKKVGPQDGPFHAVFIRAPLIESVSDGAQVLAQVPDGRIVAAQQGRLLATSFHPELTLDDRFHRYFISLAE
jgi:5'-phosphate synthase pdxT subunit